MKHRFICVSSVLINWCWMWSVAFLMTCLRNGNGCSPQKSDIFIMITTTVLWYLGFQMNLYFILSFSFFSVMSRQSQPTDWPTLFVVTLFPGTFSLRKWFEDTRLEGNLARGGGGGVTPWCSWWGWASRFSISWTYFKPNMLFSTPIFRPAAKILNTDNNKKVSSEWYIAVCCDWLNPSLLSVYFGVEKTKIKKKNCKLLFYPRSI